jgi:hypothetical protein
MKPSLPDRATALFMWPVGVALTSWSYIWRTTPLHRSELEGSPEADLPPEPPPAASLHDVQRPEDGAGPLFHRTYTAVIRDPRWGAAELMAHLQADPNLVTPLAMARFRKTYGPPWRMERGDEFLVRMPGPWDGPVRAVEVTETSFRFVTLDGHLEAGQIEWRATDAENGLVFNIESWARAGDRLSALLHDHLRMAKEVQLHMWTSVAEKVAKRAGGHLEGGITIETRRVDARALASAR